MLIVKIVNDGTGTIEKGNYDYQVFVNHDMIAEGHMYGHNRADGWEKLVEKIAGGHKLRTAALLMAELYRTDPELNMDFCYGCDVKNNPKCDKCVGS